MGWTGEHASVLLEVLTTSQERMGGRDLAASDASALASYAASIPAPDTRGRLADPAQLARGKSIFERPEVGCSGCHLGPALTDRKRYDLFGLSGVKTRSLIGVAASPPYLHDGSLPTLRAVIERSRNGEMGDTRSLHPDEMDDLEAYLLSL
jgi:cytochrome c peroxidase